MKDAMQRQRGYILWALLLGITLLIGGAWKYRQVQSEKRLQAQHAEALRTQQERETRLQAERTELENRLEKEKEQRDALTTSLAAVDAVLARWDDAVKVAGTTSRIALGPQVAALQAIKREAEQLTVPPCLDKGKSDLVQAMNSTVDGFLTFMRNELKMGEQLAKIDFDAAAMHMAKYKADRAGCPAPT
jgi:ATP-dependent 26S proteasome regulatory subunit